MSKKHLFIAGFFLLVFFVLKAQVQQSVLQPKTKTKVHPQLNTQAHSNNKGKDQDSLVRLIQATTAQLIDINGISYRKVVGPATFLHNNTYLVCDTALWNVNDNVINAIGNVQIIQENTFLQGDKITYYVALNLAEVRGELVKLYDRQGNILKTKYIDYNTKDSIGFFYNGGALKNASGNIIESINGYYYGKEKLFTFTDNVEVFTDSTFIVSNKINYYTIPDKVVFEHGTVGWQEENMLSANYGYYDRPKNIFSLTKDAYIISAEQEVWADTLKYNRQSGESYLYNNVQILDTVQKTIFLSNLAIYKQRPYTYALLTDSASVAMYSVEKNKADTLFMRADTLKYYVKPMWQVDSTVIARAHERKKLSEIDPIAEIDKKALNAKSHKENILGKNTKSSGVPSLGDSPKSTSTSSLALNKKPPVGNKKTQESQSKVLQNLNTTQVALQSPDSLNRDKLDSTVSALRTDSSSFKVAKDSTAKIKVKDTTSVTFVEAYHKIRMFRSDIQALCDSLIYTGIDSIARFYKDPIMWNDFKNQITSDSMQVCIKNNTLSKVNFLSNAFIVSKEDSLHFNQVKSTEMAAFFANGELYRFDALGGASAILYLREDSLVTTLNQKESKMLTAKIKDQQINRIRYIENIKSDAKPIFNLPIKDQRLRGFYWREKDRPKSRFEITGRVVKPSNRAYLINRPFPQYYYTGVYFKDKRDSIIAYKTRLDSVILAKKMQKELEAQRKQTQEKKAEIDSTILKNKVDSLVKTPIKDSLKLSLVDSLSKELKNTNLSKLEKRTLKKALRYALKEEKALIKAQKKQKRELEREQRRKEKALKREQDIKDRKLKKEQLRLSKEKKGTT